MCVETDRTVEIDDRIKRRQRMRYSNARQRNNDTEKRIKVVKPEKQPLFDADDPLAGVNLNRLRSLAELNDL